MLHSNTEKWTPRPKGNPAAKCGIFYGSFLAGSFSSLFFIPFQSTRTLCDSHLPPGCSLHSSWFRQSLESTHRTRPRQLLPRVTLQLQHQHLVRPKPLNRPRPKLLNQAPARNRNHRAQILNPLPVRNQRVPVLNLVRAKCSLPRPLQRHLPPRLLPAANLLRRARLLPPAATRAHLHLVLDHLPSLRVPRLQRILRTSKRIMAITKQAQLLVLLSAELVS